MKKTSYQKLKAENKKLKELIYYSRNPEVLHLGASKIMPTLQQIQRNENTKSINDEFLKKMEKSPIWQIKKPHTKLIHPEHITEEEALKFATHGLISKEEKEKLLLRTPFEEEINEAIDQKEETK